MRVRRRQKDREINKGKKNTYETKTSIHKRSGSRPSPEDTRLLFPSAGGAVSPTRFPADEQLKADIKVGAEERQAKKRAKTEPKLTYPGIPQRGCVFVGSGWSGVMSHDIS